MNEMRVTTEEQNVVQTSSANEMQPQLKNFRALCKSNGLQISLQYHSSNVEVKKYISLFSMQYVFSEMQKYLFDWQIFVTVLTQTHLFSLLFLDYCLQCAKSTDLRTFVHSTMGSSC